MQSSHSGKFVLCPLLDLVLIVEMEDLVESTIARLFDIWQAAQYEMLDAAFLYPVNSYSIPFNLTE